MTSKTCRWQTMCRTSMKPISHWEISSKKRKGCKTQGQVKLILSISLNWCILAALLHKHSYTGQQHRQFTPATPVPAQAEQLSLKPDCYWFAKASPPPTNSLCWVPLNTLKEERCHLPLKRHFAVAAAAGFPVLVSTLALSYHQYLPGSQNQNFTSRFSSCLNIFVKQQVLPTLL